MKRIGILSDTHGFWDDRYDKHFASCDEVWHAGDIGSLEVAERLKARHPLRAVCGNIDGGDLRLLFPQVLRFRCESVEVLLTHIGGYPGHYNPAVYRNLLVHPTDLFICGHSHILKVMNDPTLHCLCVNPGAAGISGFQQVRTLVRLVIDGHDIRDLEVIELG